MTFPIILVNSATGSDTAASGAGPATALTGTSASTSANGLTVTLDGSPDLTNVAVDGTHAIFLDDTTAGARNFGRITAKDDTAKTVTVGNAFGLSLSGKAWAIGGKRASVTGTTSRKLLENNSAAGDWLPGWAIEMQSGHSEVSSATLTNRRAGDITSGGVELRGEPGATVLPLLTFSNNGQAIGTVVGLFTIRDFELRNSSATKTASHAFGPSGVNQTITAVGIKVSHATDKFVSAISSGQGGFILESCEIGNTVGIGINHFNSAYTMTIINCYIHDCGGTGISIASGSPCHLFGNIIARNNGHGVVFPGLVGNLTGNFTPGSNSQISHNTIDANQGDGFRVSSGGSLVQFFFNNILSNNTGFGLNFTAGSDRLLAAAGLRLRNNVFYNNGSGVTNPSSLPIVNINAQTINPTYSNASGGDFSIGANLKATGHPLAGTLPVGKHSTTYSYVDPGASQRQEAGGGGLILPRPMNGGYSA